MITMEFYEQQLDLLRKRGNGASQHSQREAKMQSMTFYEQEVDRLFRELRDPPGTLCDWPVIGGGFVKGEDDTTQMRRYIARALRARDWFIDHGPSDAPPLPLGSREICDMKYRPAPNTALNHIVARYAVSLGGQNWDFNLHPGFDDFARGLMTAKNAPDFVIKDEGMLRRYPPHRLQGFTPYLTWQPPEQYARTMEGYRKSEARWARAHEASTSA